MSTLDREITPCYGYKALRPESCVTLTLSQPGYVERYGKAGWLLVWASNAWDEISGPLYFALAFTCLKIAIAGWQ